MNEDDLERALKALMVMVSKRAPKINDINLPAYGLTCTSLKLRRIRRLVWLRLWKISFNVGLQAIFGSSNQTCKLYGGIERARGHDDLALETFDQQRIKGKVR